MHLHITLLFVDCQQEINIMLICIDFYVYELYNSVERGEKVNCLTNRLITLRKERGVLQKDIAKEIGITAAAYSLYEKGKREPSLGTLQKMADYFNVSADYLMGIEPLQKPKPRKGVIINVLGRVAAGVPIEAITDIIDTEEITEEMAKTGEFFGLQIKGDSMEPRMAEGDVVIVRQQDDAESGDIVIATINGNEATCKRLRKYRDGIELVSNNPSYEPMFFSNDDIVEKPVKIIGKVVELRAKF